MAHFTQLNLQGNSGNKTVQNPGSQNLGGSKTPQPKRPDKKQPPSVKAVALSGSLVAAALVAALAVGTNGCSKSGKPAKVTTSSPTVSAPQTAPVQPLVATSSPAAAPKAARSARQHTVATYKNADYGVSFRYPKTYSLTKGDDADAEWKGLGPVEMNYIQPGGTTLAAVELPDGMYPGTNLASAFFTVAVNSKLTAKDCAQFAFEDARQTASTTSEDDTEPASATQPTTVKLGAAEFTEVATSGGESNRHADAKYYHVFQNGACYEFALGMETTDGKTDVKPVDSKAVFGKLNWMLSTVKITAAGIPAKTTPAIAESKTTSQPAAAPADSSASPVATTAEANTGKN